MDKRKTFITVLVGLGLVGVGNTLPKNWVFSWANTPPKLDVNRSLFQRAFSGMQDLDLYRVALKFDEPVSLKGSVTLTVDGESFTETLNEPEDYASYWLVYFSPGNGVRFKSEVTAINSFQLTATNQAGMTSEFSR